MAIAKELGIIEDASGAITGAELSEMDDETFERQVDQYSVYARVQPEHKVRIVSAWKKRGMVTAMTGDGVNDTLALKQADCSVAMAAGSDAARNVAQLVLVDNDFAAMPKVVAEGRRVINNIQRSASLFLVKNIFSFLLSIVALALPLAYPFQPLQLSLVTFATIGAPAFFLALEPNHELVHGEIHAERAAQGTARRADGFPACVLRTGVRLCVRHPVRHGRYDLHVGDFVRGLADFVGCLHPVHAAALGHLGQYDRGGRRRGVPAGALAAAGCGWIWAARWYWSFCWP